MNNRDLEWQKITKDCDALNSMRENTTKVANVMVQDLKTALADIRNEQQLLKLVAVESRQIAEEQRKEIQSLSETQSAQQKTLIGELAVTLNRIQNDQRQLQENAIDSQHTTMVQHEKLRQMDEQQSAQKKELSEVDRVADQFHQQVETLEARHQAEILHMQKAMMGLSRDDRRKSAPSENYVEQESTSPREGPVDKEQPGMRRGSAPETSDKWRKGAGKSHCFRCDDDDGKTNGEQNSFPERNKEMWPTSQTILRTTITKPPLFREGQYEEYRRAISWRLQLQAGVSADRLLAAIGVNEVGPAKWVLNDYFNATKTEPQSRTVEGFAKVMDARFRRPSEDSVLSKLTQWSDFKKEEEREHPVILATIR